jgi:alcohol dehydrogenase class IV
MPGNVTGNTGIDAFSHALEGYFTEACTGMMEALAVDCFKRVKQYLPEALVHPENINARSQMMMSALEGGLVLTCCGSVLVHAMGYGISKALKMQHGLANAIFLPAFLECFVAKGNARAQLVMDIFDGKFRQFVDESLNGTNRVKISEDLKEECVRLGMAKLKTLGAQDTGLPNCIIPLEEGDVRFVVENSSIK